MLNSAYDALRIFLNKFSEEQDIKGLKGLIQGNSALDLLVHFDSNLPISLCWDARSDAFTGSQSFTVFPKLVINGELYEGSFKHDLRLPVNGFAGLEAAFLNTLREAIATAQRVWD